MAAPLATVFVIRSETYSSDCPNGGGKQDIASDSV